MHLQTAVRKQTKTRLALMGKSGTGKTYSALLLAYGICNDWNKIALIDTEQESASLYSHLGPFSTIQIGAPYHPSRYFEAIDLCEDSGKEVIIIDSLSPKWTGEGGVMERLDKPFYEEAFREHRCLLSQISNSTAHIICTLRSKQKLIRIEKGSRKGWQLMEMPVQQEGIEYSFTTVLSLDNRHKFHVVKDRTNLFNGKEPAPLEVDHGLFLGNWCKSGEPLVPGDLQHRINSCQSVPELHLLLSKEDVDTEHIYAFTRRRIELEYGSLRPQMEKIYGGRA